MQYTRLLLTLSCIISTIYSNPILDIEDYEFYFQTYSYKFPIEYQHSTIKYPLNNNLNLTFNIIFNETISLSINNVFTFDFFDINSFREITYISSINNPNTINKRLLLEGDDEENEENKYQRKHPKVVKGKESELGELFAKQAADAVKKAEHARPHVGSKTKGHNKRKYKHKNKIKTKKMKGNGKVKDLEKAVMKQIHKRIMKKRKKQKEKARRNNKWRNRMFDKGMYGHYRHPGFPSLQKWRKFRRENIKIDKTPFGINSQYDKYKRFRDIALHQAGQFYDQFHNGPNGDLPGHGPIQLQTRYKPIKIQKGPRYKPKQKPYPLPPNEPREVPYHHGKYIGVPDRKSWFMAQQFCREQYGTNLASVMNEGESNEIRHVCNEVAGYGHCWIGLRRPFGTWQDGKPVIISNYGTKGVNNLHEQPLNCIELMYSDQTWHAQLCTVRRPFICEIPRKRTRGKYIGIGKTLSWESAENYCQQTYNTDLAAITNKVENRLAMNLCRDISSDMHHCWIGLIKPYKLWTDGTHIKYKNFNKHGFTPDHKGVDLHENKQEKPEPYDEDHQKSSFYPAAHQGEQGEFINAIGQGEMEAMRRKMEKESDKNKHAPGPDVKMQGPPGGKDGLEKKFINENDPDANKKQLVPENDPNRKLEKQEAALENKNEKIKEAEEELEKELKSGKPGGDGKGNNKIGKGKAPDDQCVQIDTSYGGTWDKARCSFRHFFLCNNPGWKDSSESNEESESSEELLLLGAKKGKKKGGKKKHNGKKKQGHAKGTKKAEAKFMAKAKKAKAEIKKKDKKKKELEKKVVNAVKALNGKEGELKRRAKAMNKEMERDKMMRDAEVMGGRDGGRERRLIDDGEFYDYGYGDEGGFGGLMKKAGGFLKKNMGKITDMAGSMMGGMGGGGGGAGGGGYTPGDVNRVHNRDRFRREQEGGSRWKRREKRRRRRRRRRKRFKRWLKKHYGRGYRKKCKHCPIRKIHIRSLPQHMHWSPLSGLLPMFGVSGLHRPKKSPKIHIVAKVHLPKHRTLDTGYLDYGLLNKLLFNDHAKKGKGPLLTQLAKKYRKIENSVKPKKGQELANGYNAQGNFDRSEEEKRLYKQWDRANDRRAEKANTARRMIDIIDENDDDELVNMICMCRMVEHGNGDTFEICMNYDVMDMMMNVEIKSMEYKKLRDEKRRVWRDVMHGDSEHYKDHMIIDYESERENDELGDNYVLFEPIDGNLGWAMYKYEMMDWHWVKDNDVDWVGDGVMDKYGYGEFNEFGKYIHFNQKFEMVYSGNGGVECSVVLVGLPFKMCIDYDRDNGMKLYFEKDEKYDVLDAGFSFRFKEFIDNEFENEVFVFNDDRNWDEINVINSDEYMEKCSYLHIAKICMKNRNIDNSMTASIAFQLMNKQMILDENK